MSASTARVGVGGTIKKASTAIGLVTGVTTAFKRNMVRATHLLSDNGAEEYVPGTFDGGIVTVELDLDPSNATHQAAITDLKDGSRDTYSVLYPKTDGTTPETTGTVAFDARVAGLDIKMGDANEKITGTLQLQVCGTITIS